MRAALVVVLAFSLMLSPLAAATSPSLERPSWTLGDSWTYTSNTTLIPGLNLTGTVTSSVRGRVATTAGATSVEAYDVVLSASGQAAGVLSTRNGTYSLAGTWILTGEEWFEPAGLQVVYDLYELDVNGTANGVVPFSARVQNTTTYRSVSSDWRYPLVAGATGRMEVGYTFTRDFYSSILPHVHEAGSGTWNVSFDISDPVTVASAAGSFEAFPIQETWPDGSTDHSFISARVGNSVRTESYAPDGNLSAVSDLTSFRYQVLEAPTFLGLTYLAWDGVAAVVGVGVVVIFVVRHIRRKKASPPSGPDPTSGPRGP